MWRRAAASCSAARRQLCTAALRRPEAVLLSESSDGVATLTLNRPRQRNALSGELLVELEAQLNGLLAGGMAAARCVVLQGAGPVFCSGHDLKELARMEGEAERRELFELCSRVMQLLRDIPQPTLCAAHGVATAAGCQMVAAADMAVAGPSTKFATPGVQIGLFCSTPAVALARSIGNKAAMDMLLTGRLVAAPEALQLGLISRVVGEAGTVEEEREATQRAAAELAAGIASRSGVALEIGKATYYAQRDQDLPGAYAVASEAMARNMASEDAAEGIGAFLERRQPTWLHR